MSNLYCRHCGVASPEDEWHVLDDETEEMNESMHGDVGFVAECPECGEVNTLA